MCCGQKRKSVETTKRPVAVRPGAPPRPVATPPTGGRGRQEAPVTFVK